MRKVFFLLLPMALLFLFTGCDSEEDVSPSDGLSEDIKELVPEDVLKEMEEVGINIHRGDNPPSFEGTYRASPFVLENSNIPEDQNHLGHVFGDMVITFSNQNNASLTARLEFEQGSADAEGVGGYISGDADSFTFFGETDAVQGNGVVTRFVNVISATKTSDGLRNFQFGFFMLDDGGDPDDNIIEVGQGRKIVDGDGFSPEM